jgi:HD-like signal output (HDOD) protein
MAVHRTEGMDVESGEGAGPRGASAAAGAAAAAAAAGAAGAGADPAEHRAVHLPALHPLPVPALAAALPAPDAVVREDLVIDPAPDADPDPARHAALRLQDLIDRARRQPDLPVLPGTPRAVASRAGAAAVHLQELSAVVHADPGLVWRLLRRANGALAQSSGGAAGDVPRALAMLGSETLARVAAGGPRLDLDDASPHSRLQGESCLRALIGAQLTDALCDVPQLVARAPAVGLAPHLGRMVVAVHAPQAALALRAARLVQDDAGTEEVAVRRHFGCGYDGIAQTLSQAWGLPPSLQPVPAPAADDWPRHRSDDAQERLRWLARMAHEASDLMLACALPQGVGPGGRPSPVLTVEAALAQLSLRAARVLGLEPETLRQDLSAQQARLPALLARIGLPAELLQPPQGDAVPPSLALLLQGLWRHLAPRRAVLLLSPHLGRQRQPCVVVAQRGLPLAAGQREAWQVDPWAGRDLYARLCQTGRLTLVADVMAPNLQRHLPPAFLRQPPGRHFLLLPLQRAGRLIGLIYLDRDERQPFELDAPRQQQIVAAAEAAVSALTVG